MTPPPLRNFSENSSVFEGTGFPWVPVHIRYHSHVPKRSISMFGSAGSSLRPGQSTQYHRSQFHATWGAHRCAVKGCGEWLTCDGGMKPRRYYNLSCFVFYQFVSSNVCAARYSGVISYKHTNTRVVSGCTQKPSPGNQVFCN